MRNAFADELTHLAAEDGRVVMLSGDIGNRLFDTFKAQHPTRFFNCGVAEANMISMGAGMALCGLRPVAYTITPFITTRCLEQIRVDVCYHNAPLVIVGVGAGLSYASLGATHHACEDIALLRMLPNMTVVCPADALEVRAALRAAVNYDRPVYLRIGKKGEPVVHSTPPTFTIGKALIIRTGVDVCLLSTGNLLPNVLAAADTLQEQGIRAQVVSFHTVKPLDVDLLRAVFADFKLVVTVEEHSRMGGLGGSVAEWLSDHPTPHARLLRIGTPDAFWHEAGGQSYARQQMGLDAAGIAEQVLNNMK